MFGEVRSRLWRACLGAALVVFWLQSALGNPAANNPVPLINQPLAPQTAAPGGAGFTLTVNGTGFAPAAVVNWNGSSRATHFLSASQLTATVLASDIARAGTASVTVSNPGPGGGDSNTVFFQITGTEPALGLSGPQIPGSGQVSSIAEGDFNGDGKLDLAVGNNQASSVSVMLGNGDGTFQPMTDYTVGAPQSYFVISADFNGDGKPDLAVAANGTSAVVSILLGNGDGTFQSHQDLMTSEFLIPSLAAGDFNGDGKLDLAIVGDTNAVFVALGNGDGTCQAPVSYAVGTDPQSVTVGDFNRDGKLDLAVTNLLDNTVSILLGNGDGTFRSQLTYATAPSPGYMVTGDFNQDGKLDLAMVARQENDASWVASVLLGNGDGTFQAHQDLATGDEASQLALGDFNGDGKLDLATVNPCGDDPNCGETSSGTVSILLGHGNGAFDSHVDFPAGVLPARFVAGDFNSDGKADLVTAAGALTVLLQTTAALSSGALLFPGQDSGTTSQPQTVTLTNTATTTLDISGISLTGTNPGDYALNSACGSSLLPGASCTFDVTFTPTTEGTRTAFVSIADSALGSPQTVALTGTGFAPVVLVSPTSLSFPTQTVGTTSPWQLVGISNTGDAPLNITSVIVTGDFYLKFNNCGKSLAAGATCKLSIVFKPSAAGARTGALTITDNAPGSPQTVPLAGTGTYIQLSPTSINFGNVAVGHTSAPHAVTVSNVGQSSEPITSIKVGGSFASDFSETNNCGHSLAGGASCTVNVTFTPKAKGSARAMLEVNGGGAPQGVALSGNGT